MISMARTALFVGGVRCGKSGLAQAWAQKYSPPWLYVATCVPRDAEMRQRVEAHKNGREKNWIGLEEALDPAGAVKTCLERHSAGAVLLDCLSMWVANQLEQNTARENIPALAGSMLRGLFSLDLPCAIVSVECNLGFVPVNALARDFGDILGSVNQLVASMCAEAYFVCCGQALELKKSSSMPARARPFRAFRQIGRNSQQ